MKNLFIHIGAHKTGTTTIQHTFGTNRAALAQQGFSYPSVCWYHFAQHRLGFAAKAMPDTEKRDWPDLGTEIGEIEKLASSGRAKNIILSSEELFCAPLEAIEMIGSLSELFNIRILAFTRRQDELFASMYNQNVKQPGNKFTASPSDYLDQPSLLHGDLDLLGCLERWASVFGERLDVCLFEAGNTMETVCNRLGIVNFSDLAASRQMNRSVPPKALEIVRRAKMSSEDRRVQKIILDEAIDLFKTDPAGKILSISEARAILEAFDADNDRMFAKFGLGENIYHSSRLDGQEWPHHDGADREDDLMRLVLRLAEKTLSA